MKVSKKKTFFDESAMMNNRSYGCYMARLTELALSMFEWEGLPDSIDARFMELTLFTNGSAVFFEDEALGHLCLPCAVSGQFNVYNVPIRRMAYANNGYNRELNADDSVIIYNNYLRQPTAGYVEYFARRLWNLDRAIDVNANAQKTPILLTCDETQRLTVLNLFKEYDGNAPVIMGTKGLDTKGIGVLKTDAPYVADRLHVLKQLIWSDALTFLGISNVPAVKKERLITDEVIGNEGAIAASRNSRLAAREQACDEINRMFGLSISCKFKTEKLEEPEVLELE